MKEAVQTAIHEAEVELTQIHRRLEELMALQSRRQVLEVFISAANEVLKTDEPTVAMLTGPRKFVIGDTGSQLSPDRLWEAIHIVMGLEKKPMTAAEVLERLTAQRVQVEGVHKRESVRSAMMRKDDVFERVGRGFSP